LRKLNQAHQREQDYEKKIERLLGKIAILEEQTLINNKKDSVQQQSKEHT
jgi:hypothetical protein